MYVVLDRDGVINEDSDAYIRSPDDWVPIPGSLEAIELLYRNGMKIVVITNQSGIARKLFTLTTLAQIHDKMRRSVEAVGGKLEDVFYCPHGPEDACGCRKPRPGLFLEFAKKHRVTLSGVFAVGDSLRDIQAAQASGALPLLVETGKGLHTLRREPQLSVPVFENLYEAALHILHTRR